MTTLCQLLADWRGTVPQDGLYAEEKIDGWRASRFPGIDGKVRLWTRNGHPIEGTGHILHKLSRLERAAGEPMFFDGEFQVGGTLAATKHWCETGWKLGGEAGVYHLFDAVPLSAWQRGLDPTPLYQRKARLAQLMEACSGEDWEWREGSRGRDEGATPVVLIPDEWVFTPQDALRLAGEVWVRGGEGVVLKRYDSPYQRSRSADWMKIKIENEAKWRAAA